MRPGVCNGGRAGSMVAAGSLVLAALLLSAAAWSREDALPSGGKAGAAAFKRDSARCRTHSDVAACYDAVRRNPGDPALLVALGDALMSAKRPADAIRNYRRAAALAPAMRGVAAKISAAEAKMQPKVGAGRPSTYSASSGAAARRYSNAATEAQSH